MKKILFLGLISAIIFSNINAISPDSDSGASSARNIFIELRRRYNRAQNNEQRDQALTELRELRDSLRTNVDEHTTYSHINRFINSVATPRPELNNSVRSHLAAQFAAIANISGSSSANSGLSLFSPETAMSGLSLASVQNAAARRDNPIENRFPFELGRGIVHSGLLHTASDQSNSTSSQNANSTSSTSRQDQETSDVQQPNNAPRNAQQIARDIQALAGKKRCREEYKEEGPNR